MLTPWHWMTSVIAYSLDRDKTETKPGPELDFCIERDEIYTETGINFRDLNRD